MAWLSALYCFSISVPNVIPEWFNATVIAPYNKKGEGSYVVKIELYDSIQSPHKETDISKTHKSLAVL